MADKVAALRAAVAADPDNTALAALLADLLRQEGEVGEALELYNRLLAAGDLPAQDAADVATLALDAGRVDIARGALEFARSVGVVDGISDLDKRLHAVLSRGVGITPADEDDRTAPVGTSPTLVTDTGLTFGDVGGMEDVKKVLHRLIIMPFIRPELYKKYGRKAGGGVLLYGPPGCGKTLLAKAIAGECGLPFFAIGIDDVVSPWQGQAELNIAEIFAQARDLAPSVVFLDEVDALGFARQRSQGEMARRMTNTLLQELDGVGRTTEGLLVLAASNAPWDVDSALLRPGRFDRSVFVPPPDAPGREEILRVRMRGVEATDVNFRSLATASDLFTGADLRSTVERALDAVIERVLDTGVEEPVSQDDLVAALREVRPSSLDWLARARDYVEFSNSTGQWAEVESYLSQRSVRKKLAGG